MVTIKQVDVLHAKIILLQGDRCVICEETDRERLTCGHIFSRASFNTRWDIQDEGNCHIQCWDCNAYHETVPFEDSPFVEWFKMTFGIQAYQELKARHNRETDLSQHQIAMVYGTLLACYDNILAYKYPGMIATGEQSQ